MCTQRQCRHVTAVASHSYTVNLYSTKPLIITTLEFVILKTFDNYIEAHMLLTRLNEEGFNCWLKDENIVTLNPVLANAVGGIKLMVAKDEKETAEKILEQLFEERKASYSCPKCNSHNIEFINTPRNPVNWFSAIVSWFVGSYAIAVEQIWRCFDCNAEFKEPVDNIDPRLFEDPENTTE